MKLYLLTRTDDWGYDSHDAFVVAAENEESALEWHPYGDKREIDSWGSWTRRENIKIQCIGKSNSPVEKVIIASFNAG